MAQLASTRASNVASSVTAAFMIPRMLVALRSLEHDDVSDPIAAAIAEPLPANIAERDGDGCASADLATDGVEECSGFGVGDRGARRDHGARAGEHEGGRQAPRVVPDQRSARRTTRREDDQR